MTSANDGTQPRRDTEATPVQRVPGVPGARVLRRADGEQPRPRRERVVLGCDESSAEPLPSRVELAEQTGWGEILIKDLIGAQLRVGLALTLACGLLLAALPLLVWLFPAAAQWSVGGVPMMWLLLGFLPFPLLWGAGVVYHQAAERLERAFVDMIE